MINERGTSTVICQLCGVEFQKITNTHLKRAHPGYTTERYCEEFGEKSLMSDDWRWIIKQYTSLNAKTNAEKVNVTKKDKQSVIATEFTPEEYQVVLGGLLGDASLFDVKKIKYPPEGLGSTYWQVSHKFTQLPYMAWEARMLSRFGARLFQRFSYNTVKRRFDVEHRVNTARHYLFGNMARDFYPAPDFKKVLPLHLVEKLEPLGLAIWYQDDGHLSKDYLDIATNCFEVDSVKQAAEILSSKFDIDFRIHTVRTDNIAQIAVNKSSFDKFFRLVEPFIHPCMLYKIGKKPEVIVNVTKRLKLTSAHYLLDYDGPCERLHAHGELIEISVKGPVNPDTGMVMDFGDLKKIVQPILDVWDHDVLNDVDPILAIRPTAEILATYLAATLRKYIPNLSHIKYYETDTAWADLDVEENSQYLEDFLQRLAEAGEWWQELKSTSIKNSPFYDDPNSKVLEPKLEEAE